MENISRFLTTIYKKYKNTVSDPNSNINIKLGSKLYTIPLVEYILCTYLSIERLSFSDEKYTSFMSLMYNNIIEEKEDFNLGELHINIYEKEKAIKLVTKRGLMNIDNQEFYKNLISVINIKRTNLASLCINFHSYKSIIDKVSYVAHRNMLLFQKPTTNRDKLTIFWYEPHGYHESIKFKEDIIKKMINSIYRITPVDGFFPDKICPVGLQKISNLPYCVMHSYLWLYCIFLYIKNDKNKQNIKHWVIGIEKTILEFIRNDRKIMQKLIMAFSLYMIDIFYKNLNISSEEKINLSQERMINSYLDNLVEDAEITKSHELQIFNLIKNNYKYLFQYKMVLTLKNIKRVLNKETYLKPNIRNIIPFSLKLDSNCLEDIECESDKCENNICVENPMRNVLIESGAIL